MLSTRQGKHPDRNGKVWWIYSGSKRTPRWFTTERRARSYINRHQARTARTNLAGRALPNSPKAGMASSVHRAMQGGPGEDVGSDWFQYRDGVASYAARYALDEYNGIRRPPSKASLDYFLEGAPRHLQRALSMVSREAQKGTTAALHRNYDDASAMTAGRAAGRRVRPPKDHGPQGETIAEITERRAAKKAARGRTRYAKPNSAAIAAATTVATNMLISIVLTKGEAYLGKIQAMSMEERKALLRKVARQGRYIPQVWVVKKILQKTGKDEALLTAVAGLIGDPDIQKIAIDSAHAAAAAAAK